MLHETKEVGPHTQSNTLSASGRPPLVRACTGHGTVLPLSWPVTGTSLLLCSIINEACFVHVMSAGFWVQLVV